MEDHTYSTFSFELHLPSYHNGNQRYITYNVTDDKTANVVCNLS